MRSKIQWSAGFCNSHHLSRFAAFFIDARTKRSVVKGFDLNSLVQCFRTWTGGTWEALSGSPRSFTLSLTPGAGPVSIAKEFFVVCSSGEEGAGGGPTRNGVSLRAPAHPSRAAEATVASKQGDGAGDLSVARLVPDGSFNDPSAGSPTETLLRLVLPLNDQV